MYSDCITFTEYTGNISHICFRDFDFTSVCSQRAIIDVVNLLFLSVFCFSLFISWIRKIPPSDSNCGKGWIFKVGSLCCAFISITYFSNGLWNFIAKTGEFHTLNWLISIIRGLIWISLTISLLIQRYKWMKILNFIWWVFSCTLVSALNIEIMFKHQTLHYFYIVQWPLHLLLVFCAFQNLGYFVSQHISETTIYEPLLVQETESSRTFLSKLTFSWINPLLSFGYLRPLALEDIPSLVPEDESHSVYQKFTHAWDLLLRERNMMSNTKNLVLWSIVKNHLKDNLIIATLAFLRTISLVLSPLILYAFVNYTNHSEQNMKDGLCIVGFLIISKLVESLSQRHWFFNARRSGMRMRSALMVAVYKKQLKLSSLAKRRHSTGEIVNYIAVDAYRMGEFPWWFHSTWTSALQILLGVGVLFSVVGLGALPGLVPLLICGLLNVPFAKVLQKCQTEFMTAQDERLRATSEILNSMKIIKLQSWEDKFKNLVESLRHKEVECLGEAQFKKAHGTFMYWMTPAIISSVIFLGCAIFQSAPLNAETIFTVLATLRIMAEPVRVIPEALSVMIQVKVSFDRLNTFLLEDEIQNDDDHVIGNEIQNSANNSIEIHAGNFSWGQELLSPTLRDVNLEIKWRQKVAVCGPVGAGKSSLLCTILREIPKISGSVSVGGTLAYVSQTSWIQSGTIRDNILYGKPMDITRYKNAIRVCALDKDINCFIHGDLTEIGQRGVNMSGGQKQRIQLARAVYNDADIYLLDDPFSAVDAHTATVLFHDCVMTALREKTVILVTHQVEFLSEVDKILVMEGGKITQSGGYEDLLTTGTAFEQLVNAHRDVINGVDQSNENQVEPEKTDSDQPEESHGFHPMKDESEAEISTKRQQLTQEEEKEIGDVGLQPFWDYIFISKGSLVLTLMLLSQLAFVALQAASTFWLALAIEIPKVTSAILIGVYTTLSFLCVVSVYLRAFCAAYLGLKASKAFFSCFTNAIFNAPMLFFDSTPVGRILTRASSDFSILDFDIPFSINFVAAGGIELLTMIGIMASVTWQVLIVAILAMVASIYILSYYQSSARELIRINGTTKAPIMNFTAETSLGVVTVRAFNMVDRFFQSYLKIVDTDATLFFHSNAAMEWIVLRIEGLQNLTLFTAAFLLVLLPKGHLTPGLVGLSLSYALTLTQTQIFLTRWFCSLSNHIISVERIKQFIHIPAEPPSIVETKRPPSSWPSKGRIDLQALKIRYSPNAPLVLKGITCTLKQGNRVGVVGRTGSGKTTLISALFRLVEPASGNILIDDLNICSMGLKDLRMKLSIIPQEPTLFRGSVRTNLDPLGLYTDDEIWKALEKCQLKATVSNLPKLLDSSVSDEGENWSVGQRQLFCLGRVVLKRNKILVLDEATASIDSATDSILQRVIRQEFAECTVITVAHRVPTVIDSNMIMVLSYGELVEYDEPSKLMETNSSFSKLVAEYWSSCRRNSSQNISKQQH
ncbi:ABC transporter C family member 8-like isoform X1 [Senna tora]|uniref:ABC-type xenobiotic transporter n=1 Tax=Senna tora TaxID=362788 RepID=A0A834XHQ6_9FABA|nr:ABC transporter C family member 8-like isoform X1 [Senna tora]